MIWFGEWLFECRVVSGNRGSQKRWLNGKKRDNKCTFLSLLLSLLITAHTLCNTLHSATHYLLPHLIQQHSCFFFHLLSHQRFQLFTLSNFLLNTPSSYLLPKYALHYVFKYDWNEMHGHGRVRLCSVAWCSYR